MDDIHNYLTFARFGPLGIILAGLGLIGCLVHRRNQRFAISFAVTISGCLLLFDASARFHKTMPSRAVSLLVVGIAATAVLASLRRKVSQSDSSASGS